MPQIIAAQSIFPAYSSTQDELAEFFIKHCAPNKAALVRRMFRSVGVIERHHCLPKSCFDKLSGFGGRNALWKEIAFSLVEKCTRSAISSSGVSPLDIGHIFFTSITGISAPSIDALLVNKLRLNQNIKRTPIFGLGCLGGAALISRAADYLRAFPNQLALVIATELCSLTLQQDDQSIANIIGSGLFGDGAACVILAGREHKARNFSCTLLDSAQSFFYDTERVMGWDIKDTGFKIVLSADVPNIARNNVAPRIKGFLQKHNLQTSDIKHWVAHPGGPKVISALEEALELNSEAFSVTRDSLKRFGNLSSVSVLNVLQNTLEKSPQRGDYGLLFAMGPAFSAEMVLLSW